MAVAKPTLSAKAMPAREEEWTGRTQSCPNSGKGHLERRKSADGTYVTSWVPHPARKS